MADKKIVLFDLDGTLIDTAPDMYLALNILLDEENVKTVSYDAVSYTHLTLPTIYSL